MPQVWGSRSALPARLMNRGRGALVLGAGEPHSETWQQLLMMFIVLLLLYRRETKARKAAGASAVQTCVETGGSLGFIENTARRYELDDDDDELVCIALDGFHGVYDETKREGWVLLWHGNFI